MKNKTAGEVVAEVKMMIATRPRQALLIVEGADDCRFWKPRVHATCIIIIATGKNEGVVAVRKLTGIGIVGHLGVFDRDYADMETQSSWQANEIYWPAHSLETVLFYSTAFDKLVAERTNPERLVAVQAALGQPLRDAVEHFSRLIGVIRYLHFLAGGMHQTDAVSPFRHRRKDGGVGLDVESLLAAGVDVGAAPSVVQLRARIRERDAVDGRLLIRGHDVCDVVSILVGSCGGHCTNRHAEELLRTGFEDGHLAQTSAYTDIRAWETARHPCRILI